MSEAQSQAGPRRLADFIRQHTPAILAAWEESARKLRPARNLPRLALLDHMPQFLETLAAFIDGARAGLSVTPDVELPRIHALERLDEGYDLAEVVAEYGVLRHCLVAIIQREHSPSARSAEMPRLHQAIDEAISTSVVRFTQARERTLRALDRISTASLSHPDVQGFLSETLRVLLETTAAVDSVAVLLVEEGRLRLRASAGNAAPPGASLRIDECFAGRIAQERRPLESTDAAGDPRVTCDLIERESTRALYGVPLLVGEELIGVAVMGSGTTSEFSHEDRLLFRTTAARATTIIVQGKLREELEQQKDFYASLLQAQSDLGEGFVLIRDERVTHVNDAFCRLTGYTREELLALPSVGALAPPEEAAAVEERRARRLRGEPIPETFETALVGKDGRRLEVEMALQARGDQLVCLARDITGRRAAVREQELESARLSAVLRVLPVGVAIAEAPGGEVVRNDAFERIWGLPPGEGAASGRRAYRGRFSGGAPIEPHQWPLERALRGETVAPEELHIFRADGGSAMVESAAAPIRDAQGRVVAAVATMVDITGRKQQEQELRRALAFRDEIMAVLSHDLRSPLMVVMTGAELLLRGTLDERQARSVQRIRTAGHRIERMIRDLLDYTRARHGGGLPIALAPTDLAQLCRQMVESFQETHPGYPLELRIDGDARGLWDPDRLLQVLSNLLGNAVRHGGGATARLVVRGESAEVVLEVHNGGPPIPPAVLPIVFEPFRRGGQKDSGEGLGLGLYIVSAIVEAHGGTVAASSSPAEGTTFTVRLPRAPQGV